MRKPGSHLSVLVWGCCLLLSLGLTAQDQHFTQFYNSPLTLNPALTGAIEGTYRFSINYRDQGRSLVEVPFNTVSAAIDMRLGLDSRKRVRDDKAGIGMVFFSDRSAFANFYTNYIGLSGAFHKALDKQQNQFLSIGFQGGVGQRNVNYDNFRFDDQFDGSSNYDLPTGEVLPLNNFSYADLAVGLNYVYAPAGQFAIYLGGSMYHILEPEVGFYTAAEVPGSSRLYRKYSLHAGFRIPITSEIALLPRALGYLQGPHMAFNAGSNIRFAMGTGGQTALHLGGWGRLTNNELAPTTLDAMVGMVGIEYNSFLFGFSYDAKLLSIAAGGRSQGALEFSITYLGNYISNNGSLCPSF